jgi:hypothetical protein
VWQALHAELSPLGVDVVTVALDADASLAHPWIDAAAPTHVSLIDRGHVTGGLLGFVNVPMAMWIDETATIVRPAEAASVQPNSLRGKPLPEGLPERITARLEIVQQFEDGSDTYLAAIRDWAEKGSASAFALSPDDVVARSQPRDQTTARAAACFELGEHVFQRTGLEAAAAWWRKAHELDPTNWTYRRQAWSLATTQPGQPSDLIQEPTELFEGNWLDDVIAGGGAAGYNIPFSGASSK